VDSAQVPALEGLDTRQPVDSAQMPAPVRPWQLADLLHAPAPEHLVDSVRVPALKRPCQLVQAAQSALSEGPGIRRQPANSTRNPAL